MDQIFHALSDATRRQMLRILAGGERSVALDTLDRLLCAEDAEGVSRTTPPEGSG